MKFRTASIAAIFAASAILGSAQAGYSSSDTDFVTQAQSDLLGQYALAALARSKASNPNAKALANQIATNADSANNFLKRYAAAHNVALPNKPGVRTDMQYGDLQSDKGSSFDKQFAQDINVDVQMQVGDFQDGASSASDPSLKAFAKQQVAELQKISVQAAKLEH